MKYLKWLFRNKTAKSNPKSQQQQQHHHGGGEQQEPAPERETVSSFGEIEETVVAENDGEQNGALALTGEDRMTSLVERPPSDDVCPICFGDFEVPCRAPCGHWFCGSCVLQYWSFRAAPPLQPCKCPMCMQHIMKLTPHASLFYRREPDIQEVLKKVDNYNRLFVGGLRGVLLKLLALPSFCIKRTFQEMLNIDRPGFLINNMRAIAALLALLYSYSPVDFLGIGDRNLMYIFDLSAIALLTIVFFVNLFFHIRREMNAENRQVNNLLAVGD